MKTKLTFLLTLTFLFLFSGSVYGDDFKDGRDAYVRKDFKEAIRLFALSVEQGSTDAEYFLHAMANNGFPEALAVLIGYSKNGSAKAKSTLYHLAMKNVPEALEVLTNDAINGIAKAQNTLGFMYEEGTVLLKDYKKSEKWYRLSAAQGNVIEQYVLGQKYEYGLGVPQNYKEAFKWYKLSADKGDSLAQSNLGWMYAEGKGVPQDYHEAGKWYRLSAEQGNSTAQFNVGTNYYFGAMGATPDYVQAHKWFNLAESNGNESGRELREVVEALMSPSQIYQAQEMARQWLAEHQDGKQKSGTQIAQTPQPMARIGSSEPINATPHKEQSLQQEAYRLAQERQLFEEERKKWEAFRLAEENRQQQAQADDEQTPQSGTGSGFFVSKMGHVITNAHVVKGCKKLTVGDNANKQVPAEIINTDRSNDLALLKLSNLDMASADSKSLIQKLGIAVVPLASKGLLRSEDVRRGEKILVAGYPFGDFISNTMKVTTGIVSATLGAGDDSGQFQLDAAIQPGNSGGPIYDYSGNIVGVVVSQLNKMKMVEAIGTIPENQNFGIKASTVRQFLESGGLPSKKSERTKEKSTEEVAQIAENQALMVMCFQ